MVRGVCRHLVLLCTSAGIAYSFAPSQVAWVSGSSLSHPPWRSRRAKFGAFLGQDHGADSLQEKAATFTQSPNEIFAELAGSASLLGRNEMKRWGELQDLISDGVILPSELENMFAQTQKAPGTKDKLDKSGFLSLYNLIDDLFENDTDGETSGVDDDDSAVVEATGSENVLKHELLSFLSDIHSDMNRLPCGLDCTDKERAVITRIVAGLEGELNLVKSKNGKIEVSDLIGDWDLLYTNSYAMIINKSLSGLGRSSSSMANFGSLTQKLTGSKYLGFVEYIETFTGPEGSFDVTITGEWMLKDDSNPFTGESTTVIRVEPEKVAYGPVTNDADTWTSLGPIKALDIIYLTGDLQIVRGNANTESIFVLKRSK